MYNSTANEDKKLKQATQLHMKEMLEIAGAARLITWTNFAMLSEKAFSIDKILADASHTGEDSCNVDLTNNELNVSNLPNALHFSTYAATAKINVPALKGKVYLQNVSYMSRIADITDKLDDDRDILTAFKAYLSFRVVGKLNTAGVLGKEEHEKLLKLTKVETGISAVPPDWKLCEPSVANFLGNSMGKAFIHKHFTASRRNLANRVSPETSSKFGYILDGLHWLDHATRVQAKPKLAKLAWKSDIQMCGGTVKSSW